MGVKTSGEREGRLYASLLRGTRVIGPAGTVGRLWDLVIKVDEPGDPAVVGLIVRVGRHARQIPWDSTARLGRDGSTITVDADSLPLFERRDGEMLVIEDILDAEAVDRQSVRVVRVNDALISIKGGRPSVAGIDASAAGLYRRLAPRWLAGRFEGEVLSWDRIEPMVDAVPDVDFRLALSGFSRRHPSDIAKLIDHLPYPQGARSSARSTTPSPPMCSKRSKSTGGPRYWTIFPRSEPSPSSTGWRRTRQRTCCRKCRAKNPTH